MPNPRTAVSASTHWKYLLSFAVQAAVILAAGRSAQAQTAETLSQVRKVYIESFGRGDAATGLRAEAIKQIRKNGRLEVVTSPTEADAIVKGNVSIWATGSVSAEPRASSNSSVRVFHGFLSVEIDGRNNEPLWSYLVTPSKFRTGTIIQDLANQ